jgi:hypothetical protein
MSHQTKSFFIQFRVSPDDFKTFERVAKILYEKKVLKNNTVANLVKSCAYSQINQYFVFEAKDRAFEEVERRHGRIED